jgi:prepilin-type N-terminal cleavage/methylation domain-containing protein/prepilin-type processing-associated H-X9-DG protein
MTLWPLRRLRGAFTLTELLVTIGIIAILSSLLLPIATRMSERAKSTRCVANLRQVGIAVNLYFAERGPKQTFHYGRDAQGNTLGIKAAFYQRLVDEGYVNPKDHIFTCPANKYSTQFGWQRVDDMNITYGWNTEIHDGHNPQRSSYNISAPHVGRYFIIADMDTSPESQSVGPGISMSTLSRLGFLHDKKCNILFPDAHVESKDEKYFSDPNNWRPPENPPWF